MRGSTDVSPCSSSLIAFKPRQVLLLEQRQQRNRSASKPMAQLKTDDESTLIFSVALWLQNKGFSKVLKRFCAAAQIEGEDWKGKALNLDEVFSKYLEISNSVCKDLKCQEKQEEQVADTAEKAANGKTDEESKGKKKKKKQKSKDDTSVDRSEETPRGTAVTGKINESYDNGNEDETRKELKKSNGGNVPEITDDQSTKKPKEKKKKTKLAIQSLDADVKQIDVVPKVIEQKQECLSSKKSKKAGAVEDVVDESKKASKKRKRMASDENENKSSQEVAVEESKHKKAKGLEEAKDDPTHAAFPGDNGPVSEPASNDDGSTENTANDNEMEKSNQKKSANKQPKSSEPNTIKAFQRVKIDEVEFVDGRLTDNSYWAKDGAETGYGAKAQEILGQVKGRGFRHEKTKKKRGSYRGGQIDLQSHSVKFNYSDEE